MEQKLYIFTCYYTQDVIIFIQLIIDQGSRLVSVTHNNCYAIGGVFHILYMHTEELQMSVCT